MYRPASFTYAFGSPEKGLMVYVWILAANLSKKTPLSSTATYMRALLSNGRNQGGQIGMGHRMGLLL
jgi:hypothetical protein